MSVTDRIQGGDLYALLALSSTEDLDPIVKVLLDASTNSLEQDPVYKKHAPNHCMYTEQIGSELRLFGGDILRNLSRGKGPSYGKIVLDVCQRLDSPCKDGDVVGNESTLLTLCMQGQWDALTNVQQIDMITEGRNKASAYVSDLPLAVLAPLLEWTGPAYQVTVPCVLQIAFLRRRLLDAMTRAAVTPVTASDFRAREDAIGLMICGDNDDRPLLSLVPVKTPVHGEGWRAIAADDDGIGRLNLLLQAVPSIASAAEGFGALAHPIQRVEVHFIS